MRLSGWIMLLALAVSAGCSKPGPLDAMHEGERGRVVRIIDGDALVLDTGQSVRLVGIEAPALNKRYGDPDAYAEKAARALEDMVMGREVRLHYPGLTRDRYDRALAHLSTEDGAGPSYWVNLEMVRQGHVRVRLYPDTDGAGAELFAAEKEARERGLGLWSLRDYRPKPWADFDPDYRGFAIVEGVIDGEVDRPDEEARRTLCARAMRNSDLVIDIAFTARTSCDVAAGTRVELRGWISEKRMELVHPLHLEVLPEGGD
ncbi:thermonuclease family protein [Henriciella sp. AS95]|uniref:thermonuclease family protein n=1 Tax=Henriciella sp. AS95 TaxID=3135782 RepID=UPI003171AEEC